MNKTIVFEIVLVQMILLCIIWLTNDYIGLLLSVVLGLIALIVLIISYVVEWIEKSKVPKWYFTLLWWSSIISFLTLFVFTYIKEGQFDWFNLI